ncbi:MAG: type II secretion system protein [Clostridia bacterium]|nr:type II secretion system protein [Clostridia bacterium]
MKRLKNNSGISITTLVITIVVMLIIAGIAVGTSTEIIDDSVDAKKEAAIFEDNEEIRALLMNAITDKSVITGFALVDGSIEVVDEEGNEYGTNYYLIPGGDEEDLAAIREKTGDASASAYKGITAPYVVDYYTGKYHRIEDVKFK